MSEYDQIQVQLSIRYGKLNALYENAENLLRKLKACAEVWTFYDSEGGQSEGIGMYKCPLQWRLCHCYRNDKTLVMTDIRPIVDCPSSIRIRAVQELPALHVAILDHQERVVEELDRSIELVSDFCKQLEQKRNDV